MKKSLKVMLIHPEETTNISNVLELQAEGKAEVWFDFDETLANDSPWVGRLFLRWPYILWNGIMNHPKLFSYFGAARTKFMRPSPIAVLNGRHVNNILTSRYEAERPYLEAFLRKHSIVCERIEMRANYLRGWNNARMKFKAGFIEGRRQICGNKHSPITTLALIDDEAISVYLEHSSSFPHRPLPKEAISSVNASKYPYKSHLVNKV